MELIYQPFGVTRLGEYLVSRFNDEQWTEFRAAVAFVKRSGTQYIAAALRAFDERASVRVSAGIDLHGTSHEGLSDLLQNVTNGEVWIYHNNAASTFHPKMYLFKNEARAELLVGSANLTQGGLFINYEASLLVTLDLQIGEDVSFLDTVENVLNQWSQHLPGTCLELSEKLLASLLGAGLILSEAQLAAATVQHQHQLQQQAPAVNQPSGTGSSAPPLFTYSAIPPAPAPPPHGHPTAPAMPMTVPTPGVTAATNLAHAAEATATAPPLFSTPTGLPTVTLGGATRFLMTLQNTDVGVGQTTAGTAARSPEVFIPLAALDANATFWKFPSLFTPDAAWNAANPTKRRNGIGKMDRQGVPMRIGVLQQVNLFFNPNKGDFRLRNEALRSAGNVGDILIITALDPACGYEYDVQIAAQGTPLYHEVQPYCNVPVGGASLKRFGYV